MVCSAHRYYPYEQSAEEIGMTKSSNVYSGNAGGFTALAQQISETLAQPPAVQFSQELLQTAQRFGSMVIATTAVTSVSNATAPKSPEANDPFATYKKRYGEGLAKLHGDRTQFENYFQSAMHDTALAALTQSEKATKVALLGLSAGPNLDKPTDHFNDADKAAIDKAKTQMAPIDEQIIAKKKELDGALKEAKQADNQLSCDAHFGVVSWLTAPKCEHPPAERSYHAEQAKATYYRIEAELNGLNAARVQAAQDYPLLLRIEPEKMNQFNTSSEASQVKFLHEQAKGVLNDIETTRTNLKNGKFNLWTMPGLRNTTAAGLGITGEQLKWLEQRAQHEQNSETAWKIGEAVLTIGFATGAAFFTGGTSLLLLGASAAIGIHGAVDTTQEYFRNNAATNTDLDPSAGLLPPDMKQHWGWVAASWIGVGLDVGMVTSTVRALRTGKIGYEAAAKSLGTDVKTLQAAIDTGKTTQLEVKTLDAAEFAAKYSDDVQAVTLLREGKDGRLTVEIVSNKALSANERSKALAEEFAHLRQLSDPDTRAKMLKLSEERLAGWSKMSPSAKRDLLHTKLEVEADAQKILLKEGGPNVDKTMAQEHLTNIEAKLGELDEAAKSGRVPEWVKPADAPRLFSKIPDQTATVKSAAGSARAEAMHPYQFEAMAEAAVEQKVTVAASSAADKAYTDAVAQGLTGKQVIQAANKAAKDAAKKVARDEAMRSAQETAEHAISNHMAFDPTKLDAATKAQLAHYAAGTMGGNARRLAGQLNGMKEADFLTTMADEVKAGKCAVKSANISGPPPQKMDIYEYADGTVVRYKPLGDMKRPGPTYSIEVKKNPNLPDAGSDSAAFKVDSNGIAVPKGPHDTQNPYGKGTAQAKEYEEALMNAVHFLLL